MLNDQRFRFFQTVLRKDEKKVAILFIIEGVVTFLLLANIIYLNMYVFQKLQPANSSTTTVAQPQSQTTQKTILPDIGTSPTLTVQPTVGAPITVPNESLVKDYFIPLGSGTNTASDWTDVPGTQATVDFGSYKNIKQIVFEASISVPTANEDVSVRLYNVSDQHPVWYSEVTMNGGASAYLISNPVAYDKGPKIYQVQMKTQLQYPANLTQSRIHITLQ